MALELRVASPCSESWESMKVVGDDDRARHCGKCRLNVFNLKELSEAEIRALLVKTEGKLCGRFYKRPDGTVLTKDCPTGLAKLRRRAMAGLVMGVAMLLSVVGYRLGTSSSCPTTSESWFDRTVGAKFYEAREAMRETRTFGPLINELWPREMTMGAIVAMPPPPSPSPSVTP